MDLAPANMVGPVTKCCLQVGSYWDDKLQFRNGQCLKFSPIKAGGRFWRVCYYPNGLSTASADYISLFFSLAGGSAVTDDEPVGARAMFCLLDQDMEPVPGTSTICSDVWEYSAAGDCGYGCNFFVKKEFLEDSEYLVDGSFSIRCDVYLERATPLPDMQQLLSSDTDVMFQVGGETFSAHSCVLTARSPIFEAEIFRATRHQDQGTASASGSAGPCIQIHDMLPEVFDALLDFAYTDLLPPEMMATTGPEEESPSTMMAGHLLVAADRFGMLQLKLICEEKLCSDINVNTAARILRLAIQHQCLMLRDACVEFLEDPPVLQAVMATDVDLLEVVAKNCPQLLKDMWADEDDDPMQEDGGCSCASEEFGRVITHQSSDISSSTMYILLPKKWPV